MRIAINGMLERGITCSVNGSFEFLLNYTSDIPDWILDTDETFTSFFGGLVDAEGSFHILKYNNGVARGRFVLKNTDLRLLEQCHTRLGALGIHCSMLTKVYDAGRQISKRGVFATKALWSFAVEGKSSVLALIDLVSPYTFHEKRIVDMARVRKNVEWRLSEEFKQEATRKRLAATKKPNEEKKKNQN
jgi:hypothetical protein